LLLGVAALFVAGVLILPIVSRPAVEPPADVQFGSPSSVAVQISNRNATPLTDVAYTCEISNLRLADGSIVGNVKVVPRGSIRKIRVAEHRVVRVPRTIRERSELIVDMVAGWQERRHVNDHGPRPACDNLGDARS
jgi:hypothetical protein